MNSPKSTYQLALNFENNGCFVSAYALFKECIDESSQDIGDLLFHCGWCSENIGTFDRKRAVSYYLLAAKLAHDIVCRMNSYFRAGWVLRHLGEQSEALKAFAKAIEIGHSEGLFNSIYNDALYWFAVTLESRQNYLDAIKLYRAIAAISDELNPESRYRELQCLIAIGKYTEAIDVSRSFEHPPPQGFSPERYGELKTLALREKLMLEISYQSRSN